VGFSTHAVLKKLEATFAAASANVLTLPVKPCAAPVEYDRSDSGALALAAKQHRGPFAPEKIGGELLLAQYRIERAEKHEAWSPWSSSIAAHKCASW